MCITRNLGQRSVCLLKMGGAITGGDCEYTKHQQGALWSCSKVLGLAKFRSAVACFRIW